MESGRKACYGSYIYIKSDFCDKRTMRENSIRIGRKGICAFSKHGVRKHCQTVCMYECVKTGLEIKLALHYINTALTPCHGLQHEYGNRFKGNAGMGVLLQEELPLSVAEILGKPHPFPPRSLPTSQQFAYKMKYEVHLHVLIR